MNAIDRKMFSSGDGKQLETSFKAFCDRPENRQAVDRAQAAEMQQALKAKERLQWLKCEEKVNQLMNLPPCG